MAERRMFAKTIIDSDAFLDMPLSTQSLYFHLSMRADDDGFINNPKKIQRMIGGSDDDLKLLIAKNFIIPFESGIVVIKHWKIHNYIRNDRYKETVYQEEMAMLNVKENKAYTLGIPNGYQMDTQVRLGKDSIGKVSIDKDNNMGDSDESQPVPKRKNFVPPSVEEVKDYCIERSNNVDAEAFVDFYESKGWMVGKNKMKDWKAAVRTWEKGNRTKQPIRQETVPSWIKKKQDFPQQNYDFDELEKDLLGESDPAFEERKEALQARLKEKYGKGKG
jgi:hypothetical protein